jgi:hypothetical protein
LQFDHTGRGAGESALSNNTAKNAASFKEANSKTSRHMSAQYREQQGNHAALYEGLQNLSSQDA